MKTKLFLASLAFCFLAAVSLPAQLGISSFATNRQIT